MNRRLSLLFLTDIHSNLDGLSALRDWLDSNSRRPDVILCGGDYLLVTEKGTVDPEKVEQGLGLFRLVQATHYSIAEVRAMHEVLAEITNRVFFVPGNHEPPICFQSTSSSSDELATNLHCREVSIAEGLVLVGLGGAPPGIRADTGEVVWQGYPYVEEALVSSELQRLESEVEFDEDQQYLLLSHFGPHRSETSKFHFRTHTVFSGSSSLDSFLSSHPNILLNLHGHTHWGFGRVTYAKNQTIVNPGAFQEAERCCWIELERQIDGKWDIGRTDFLKLGSEVE